MIVPQQGGGQRNVRHTNGPWYGSELGIVKERIRQHSKDIEQRRCILTHAQEQYNESGIQQANRDVELLKEQSVQVVF